MKKSILIICYNTLHNDPRVLRQIEALKDDFEIYTAGYSDPGRGVKHTQFRRNEYKPIDFYYKYPAPLRKLFSIAVLTYLAIWRNSMKAYRSATRGIASLSKNHFYESDYWSGDRKYHYQQLKDIDTDLILANDISALPLALKVKKKYAKIIFDAHEYHPLELDEVAEWREKEKPTIEYLCAKYMKEADLMFTVSEPIAEEYRKNYNVNPIVVTNAPAYQELQPQKVKDIIRLVHHGGAVKERLLEETIDVMKYLGNEYELDLMLISSSNNYLDYLKNKYASDKRIRFIDPVPTTEICKKINAYDIGIYILPPLNFNNINALPNKFFEFIQARLAVAIGPMPAMAQIVNNYNLGVVAKDYSSKALAEAIRGITRGDLGAHKSNAHAYARQLSSEKNVQILLKEIKKLVA